MRILFWMFMGWFVGQIFGCEFKYSDDYRYLKSTDVEVVRKLGTSQDPVLSKLANTRLEMLLKPK